MPHFKVISGSLYRGFGQPSTDNQEKLQNNWNRTILETGIWAGKRECYGGSFEMSNPSRNGYF